METYIKDTIPVQKHGSIPYRDLRILGINPAEIVDFSATVNPFTLPEQVIQAITSNGIAAYPDPECHDAREAIEHHYSIPREWIALTAGMTEVIYILPLLYKSAVFFGPTYGDYARAFTRYRRKCMSVRFPKSPRDFDCIIDELSKMRFKLIMICNPNNPTGDYLSLHNFEKLCTRFKDTMVCIDESYQEMGDLCNTALPLLKNHKNLLILKSLTKPYGAGGLRVAYAVSSGKVIRRIKNNLLPWGVNVIAQRLVPAFFTLRTHFENQWRQIHEEKKWLYTELVKDGFRCVNGRCPFFLMGVTNSASLRLAMLKKHIAIRDCNSFGLKNVIRIMPSTHSANQKFLEIIRTEPFA